MRQVESILTELSEAFAAVDDSWRIIFVNAAAERLFDRSAEEIAGASIFDQLGGSANSVFRAALAAARQADGPIGFSGYSEAIEAWLEVRSHPREGGCGLFLRDVSAERRLHLEERTAERKAEAIHNINQRIFDTTLDLILVVDRRGDFLRVSPSSAAILGYPPEELVGRSARDFIYPGDLESTRNEMRLARRGRVMRNFDSRYVHRKGHIVPLAWTGIWSEPEQQHFFVGRDMTERIAAEERLRRAQRLESIGQLTGGIAHDFNNLLAVAIGNLDLLKDRTIGDAEATGFAEAALQASLHGAELTRQLLAFARRQSLEAKAIDINERVSAIMDLLRRSLGEQIEIAVALAPGLWPASADPAQFESALVNLAINARDAMSGRGRLAIETANVELDEDYSRQNPDAAAGQYVMLAVSDNGTGMAPDVLARVFEPFYTTKAPGKGSGLGLSQVYGFAHQSQGHIKIYSEPGHGTTVRLYLPRAADMSARDAETKPASAAAGGGGERILVVEDNPAVRKVVSLQLGELGYRVIEAASGDAALGILKSGQPIDLVFTDVVMPGRLSGDELAREARALRPELKVLLTSGFAKAAMQDGQQSVDFDNLLSKPYRKIDLATKLRAILDAGR